MAYCANWTIIAMFGLDNRSLWNSERRIEGVTKLEPGKDYPGIIIFEWNESTVQEKELIDNAVFFGHDSVDQFLQMAAPSWVPWKSAGCGSTSS